MKQSSKSYLIVIVIAVAVAFVSAHYLWQGDARNVMPWGLLIVGCGLLAPNKRLAWRLGALFGFTVSYCFLWFDNTDPLSIHQFIQLFLIIPLPSLFGALCGTVLSRLVFGAKQRLTPANR